MSADTSVRLTGGNFTNWTQPPTDAAAPESQKLSREDATVAFGKFRRMVANASVLDGNVIIRDNQLLRVSYGSMRGLFSSTKGYESTAEENKIVRDFFRKTLEAYLANVEDPAKKAAIQGLIDEQLSDTAFSTPLMRRTIKLLVDAVDNAVPNQQAPTVYNTNEWKKVGGDDLGVLISKGHLKSMLTDGIAVAKREIASNAAYDVDTKSAYTKTLDRMFDYYLDLFNKNQTDGCLGAFVRNGMDPENLGKQILKQLEGRAFSEKLRTLGQQTNAQNGIFGVKELPQRAIEISKDENRVRSLENRNVVVFPKPAEAAANPPNPNSISDQKTAERRFLADLVLSEDIEKALTFGDNGGRILACLCDNTEIFASICLAVLKDDKPNAPAHPLEGKVQNGQLISADRGKRILEALKNTLVSFKPELEKAIKQLDKDVLKFKECRTPAHFRDMLFAKMDKIVAKFGEANLEGHISDDVGKVKVNQSYVKDVVTSIASVCECSEQDQEILKELACKSCDLDKRRLIAFSLRDFKGDALPGESGYDSRYGYAGFIRGMGVYANKLIQGFNLKDDVELTRISDLNPHLKSVHDAIKDSRSKLPPLDEKLIKDQLQRDLGLGKGDCEIARIDVEGSCGSASVAQTFSCKIVMKGEAGADSNVEKELIVKLRRPEIEAEFNRQAKIVGKFIDNYEGSGETKKILDDRYQARIKSFKSECESTDELVNALWGLKTLGQPMGLKDEASSKKNFTWVQSDGTQVTVEEKNFVGSENLVLKPKYDTEADKKKVAEALNNAVTKEALKEVLEKYFFAGSGQCMIIERAKGKDISKFQKEIDAQLEEDVWKDRDQTTDGYKNVLDRYQKTRKQLETLNRSLLQMKHSFLHGALISDHHFVNGDLHSDNMIFDPETGAITVIDYGKALHLTNEEAAALKGLFEIERTTDGVGNGGKMADAYKKLLNIEIEARMAEVKKNGGGEELSTAEAEEKDPYLKKLNATANLIGKDDAAGETFRREFALAYQRANKSGTSQIEIFKNLLQTVAPGNLPLPATVMTFLESYSRLENALSDVRSSIASADAKIHKNLTEYENRFMKEALTSVVNLQLENIGWYDVEVEGGTANIRAMKKPGEEANSYARMFSQVFNSLWGEMQLDLRNLQGPVTPDTRRRKLNAMLCLIDTEQNRIQEVLDEVGNGLPNIGQSLLNANKDITGVTVNRESFKDCQEALATLDKAKEAIKGELELLDNLTMSDSLFETHQIDPKMLNVGDVDLEDVKVFRLPISAEARLKLNLCAAQKVEFLPDDLEKLYCQILMGSGKNWQELLAIGKKHKTSDFVALLDQIQEKNVNQRAAVANLNRAPEPLAIRQIQLGEGADGDPVDSAFFETLRTLVATTEGWASQYNTYYGGVKLEKYASFKDILENNLLGLEKENQDGSRFKPTVGNFKKLLSLFQNAQKGDFGLKNPCDGTAFTSLYNDLAERNGFCKELVGVFVDAIANYEKVNGDSAKDPTIEDYLRLAELKTRLDSWLEQPADADLSDFLDELIADNKKLANPTVGDFLKRLDDLPHGQSDNGKNELTATQKELYKKLEEWLTTKSPFSSSVEGKDNPTSADLNALLAEFRRIALSCVSPSSITPDEYQALFGDDAEMSKKVTNKTVKDKFNEIATQNDYLARMTQGVYDTLPVEDAKFDDQGGFYQALTDEVNEKLYGNRDMVKSKDNPRNKDVWELNARIRDELNTQPHLHDNLSVIRNLFPAVQPEAGQEQSLNPEYKTKEEETFYISVYGTMHGINKTSGKSKWDAALDANTLFNQNRDKIRGHFLKLIAEMALETEQKNGQTEFVKTSPEFDDLRRILLGSANKVLASANLTAQENWEDTDGAQSAAMKCILSADILKVEEIKKALPAEQK